MSCNFCPADSDHLTGIIYASLSCSCISCRQCLANIEKWIFQNQKHYTCPMHSIDLKTAKKIIPETGVSQISLQPKQTNERLRKRQHRSKKKNQSVRSKRKNPKTYESQLYQDVEISQTNPPLKSKSKCKCFQTFEEKISQYNETIRILQNQNREFQEKISELKSQKKILQKNQKSLIEQLNVVNIKSHQLQLKLQSMTQKLKQNTKSKPQKDNPNPFSIKPYKNDPNRLSTSTLASIVELKTKIIDLSRQLDKLVNQNCDILQQNLMLKRKIQQQEQIKSKQKIRSKMYQQRQSSQIQRLRKKIKNLKNDLKISYQKTEKLRLTLKKSNHRHLNQITEIQQFFAKKYDTDFNTEIGVQTSD